MGLGANVYNGPGFFQPPNWPWDGSPDQFGSAERIAKNRGITRADVDAFALESQRRAAVAICTFNRADDCAATIDSLVAVVNAEYPRADRAWVGADTLKNVVFMLVHPDGRREPLVVGLPGDREVDLKRLEAAVSPAEPVAFADEDFLAFPTLKKGYIGPTALGKDSTSGVRYLVDPRVVVGTRWVTGANEVDTHVIDLVCGRDFTPDGVLDVAEVREGDPAPDGSGPLSLARGIEMGHIFQLGRKYAEALGLKVLNEQGKLVTVTMGSYGVGVSRAVAAVAESSSDDRGLVWPRALAPYDVHVVAAGKDQAIFDFAEELAGTLSAAGFDVLLDDRKASPGVKFTDAELLGMPTTVVVGRGLADGVIEVRDRASGERTEVAVGDAAAHLVALLRG